MYCQRCGTKMVNYDCNTCLSNANALREFEEEDD